MENINVLLAIGVFAYTLFDYFKQGKYHTSKLLKWLAVWNIICLNGLITYGIVYSGFDKLLAAGISMPLLILCFAVAAIPCVIYQYGVFKNFEATKKRNVLVQYLLVLVFAVSVYYML